MSKHFPIEFTLESGTEVVVNKIDEKTFEFNLTPEEGQRRQFTYVNEESFTAKAEETYDFEQLDALRRFWLELEKMD
jgi:outer membrane lipoprotein-sorting protein